MATRHHHDATMVAALCYPSEPVELYDLSSDPKQTTNVAAKHPDASFSAGVVRGGLRHAGVTKKYSDPRLAGLLERAS